MLCTCPRPVPVPSTSSPPRLSLLLDPATAIASTTIPASLTRISLLLIAAPFCRRLDPEAASVSGCQATTCRLRWMLAIGRQPHILPAKQLFFASPTSGCHLLTTHACDHCPLQPSTLHALRRPEPQLQAPLHIAPTLPFGAVFAALRICP